MNNVKTNPAGIDIPLQEMQIVLYDRLCESWGDITGYGRVYKTKKKERVIPEHYKGNGEYIEVLTDDKKVAIFFFVESGEIESQGSCLSKSDVDLIFLVDVAKAKNTINHYADEEIRLEVLKIAKSYFSTIESTVKGEEALSGFTTENLDFIHPFFIFKIKGSINNY